MVSKISKIIALLSKKGEMRRFRLKKVKNSFVKVTITIFKVYQKKWTLLRKRVVRILRKIKHPKKFLIIKIKLKLASNNQRNKLKYRMNMFNKLMKIYPIPHLKNKMNKKMLKMIRICLMIAPFRFTTNMELHQP